jgi:YfiH family protein
MATTTWISPTSSRTRASHSPRLGIVGAVRAERGALPPPWRSRLSPSPTPPTMERRQLGNGTHALVSATLEGNGILAAFTERTGGVSAAPYDTLNLGLRTKDSPRRVVENRRRITEALGVPPFATGQQIHGDHLVRVGKRRAGAGFEQPGEALPRADALAVRRRGIPVAVLVADCLPIALGSPNERLLLVVHAGWRGLAAGILARAIGAFERPSEVRAAIGPAIGPCHYEVGDDVAAAVAAGSAVGAVSERRGGRRFLDLPRTAGEVLRAAGVRWVEISELCTACHQGRFFSHRRDGPTGRQALVAMVM